MAMETTTIQISKYIKEKLNAIKERNGHTSMDSVIRYFINNLEGKVSFTIEKRATCPKCGHRFELGKPVLAVEGK